MKTTNAISGALLLLAAFADSIFLLGEFDWMNAGLSLCFLLFYLMTAPTGIILLLESAGNLPAACYKKED